jgi:hypothetical protein
MARRIVAVCHKHGVSETIPLDSFEVAVCRPARHWHSAVIGKQFDWVVEAAVRIFAEAFEIEIAFDEVGDHRAIER